MERLKHAPIGLGTSGNRDPNQCTKSVETALSLGYRHVDTAQMYGNERAVGEGIARADVPGEERGSSAASARTAEWRAGNEVTRDQLVVATKVHPDNLAGEDVIETARASLDRLGLDAVDLLYVHWPRAAYDPADTLPAFDQLYEEGLARNVGVSNFTPELLDEARDILDAPIVAHQVELHPLLQQDELRTYAREHDHTIVAYSPIMKGAAGEVPELVAIAEKHGITPTQVCLAWLVGLENVVAIPKATGEAHLRENLAAADVELDEEDFDRIASIEEDRRLVDPDGAPWNR